MPDILLQTLENVHTQLMDPERIPVAAAAIIVTAVIGLISGPLAGNANPFLWFVVDRLFGGFGDRLDNPQRTRADLMFRGFLVMALGLVFTIGFIYIANQSLIALPQYRVMEVFFLSLTLCCGTIWFGLLRLYFAMEGNQMGEGGYYSIARSTRTNLNASDNYGITRVAMNFSVRSFDKGLVTPVIWYLIAGLPVAIIYAVLAGLAWRFNKDGFSTGFGVVPAALERLLGFVPSIFTAFLVTIASIFTPTARPVKAITAWLGAKNRSPYGQGGLPLSALAWGLNVSLGGASQDINGSAIKAVWTGPDGASAQLDHKHLQRTIFINVIAHILFLAALAGAYIWGQTDLGIPAVIESLTF